MIYDKEFSDLAKKYNLNYQFQKFENCWDRGFTVHTYSLYNESGCFTVHYLLQRQELDFYYSKKFSFSRELLCDKPINIYDFEKEIWKKRECVWIFKKPFYYQRTNNVIKVLIEVINILVKKDNEFFGIKI